jgi:hypothetical protein
MENDIQKAYDEIHTILTRTFGYDVTLFDEDGGSPLDPKEAAYIYVSEPQVTIHIDPRKRVIHIERNERSASLSDVQKIDRAFDAVAQKHDLSTTLSTQQGMLTSKDLVESSLSSMYGRTKTSYQDLDDARLVIRHSDSVDDEMRGARSRKVKKIFIKRGNEQWEFPYGDLSGARAMIRHLSCGGQWDDEVSNHIISLSDRCIQLRNFIKKNHRSENPETYNMLGLAKNDLSGCRKIIKRLAGPKTYHSACSELQTIPQPDTEVDSDIQNHFTVSYVDPSVEKCLPILSSLKKNQIDELMELSKQPVRVYSAKGQPQEIVEYTDKYQDIGRQLENVVSCVETPNALTEHLKGLAKKIKGKNPLKEYERVLIKNFLSRLESVDKRSKLR